MKKKSEKNSTYIKMPQNRLKRKEQEIAEIWTEKRDFLFKKGNFNVWIPRWPLVIHQEGLFYHDQVPMSKDFSTIETYFPFFISIILHLKTKTLACLRITKNLTLQRDTSSWNLDEVRKISSLGYISLKVLAILSRFYGSKSCDAAHQKGDFAAVGFRLKHSKNNKENKK